MAIVQLILSMALIGPLDGARAAETAPAAESAPPARVPAVTMPAIKSWGYQLRGIEPQEIARSPYDLVVVDFASQGRPFSAAEVEAMRTRPDGSRRLVLAYLSIGEAERYRYYWQSGWNKSPPGWLGPENPEWNGNYPVRYWLEEWQKLVFGEPGSYLDRIVAAGFDGVYLDRIDVYAQWEPDHPEARGQMLSFVGALSAHARRLRPQFLVAVQNAEELLDDEAYLAAIDVVAKEDLLHGIDHVSDEKPNAEDDVTHSAELLRRARKAGKPVLVVEYLCQRPAITAATRRLVAEFGFVPFFGWRTLHRLGLDAQENCSRDVRAGRRIALLIGNADYQHAPAVPVAAADIRALGDAMRRAGFSEVRERTDLTRAALLRELRELADAAADAEWAVVYYAGLGIHFDGANYLLPVDARLARADDIIRESILLEEAARAVEGAKQVRLLLIEACRPNPFLDQLQRRGMSKPAGPGITARYVGGQVATGYAARCDGQMTQADGGLDAYTAALVKHIPTPALELPWLIERVRDSVLRATRGAQEPVHIGTLVHEAEFSRATQPPPAATVAVPAIPASSVPSGAAAGTTAGSAPPFGLAPTK